MQTRRKKRSEFTLKKRFDTDEFAAFLKGAEDISAPRTFRRSGLERDFTLCEMVERNMHLTK